MLGRVLIALNIVLFCGEMLRAEDAAELDRYLSRLGLNEVRLRLHETELGKASSDAARAREAKLLADLYSQRLLEVADQPERHGPLVDRVKELAKAFPAVDSPALRVMLLQAEYQRVETLTLRWIDDPQNTQARKEARDLLERIAPAFTKLREELNALVEEKMTRSEEPEAPSRTERPSRLDKKKPVAAQLVVVARNSALEKEIERDQVALSRALFFEGWSALFRGFVAETPAEAKTHLQTSTAAFAKLLDLSTDGETLEIPADQLGLQSVWRSRTLLGFATALAGAEKLPLAEACFAALASDGENSVREVAFYWQTLALLRTQQWDALRKLTTQVFSQTNASGASRVVSAAVLLVRNGWSQPKPSLVEIELTKLGLSMLAKWKKYDVLAALVEKYRPMPKSEDGFYALWTQGKLQFAAAEKHPQSAAYEAAERWFREALALPEAKDDPAAVANCEYGLAWCEYRREAYVDALRLFEKSALALKTLGDDSAVQAAWMVFTCYQSQHAKSKDPRDAEAAANALRKLIREFPKAEQAKRAEFMLAKLKAPSESPAASMKTLAAVTSDSPLYVSSRYELALLQHQQWAEAKSTDPARKELGEKTRREVDTYLAIAPSSEGSRRVKAALLAVSTLQASDAPAWETIAQYLDREQAYAAKLRSDDALAAEYHYRRLELAQHFKQELEIQEQAQWLADHAANTPYELPALVIVARALDQQYSNATEVKRAEVRAAAMKAYKKLVAQWGDTPEILAVKKNAVVAVSKLAQYAFDAGDFPTAAKYLDKILAAHPQEAPYIRRAGLAWWKAKEPAKALHYWQKLVAGGESGSAAWYEAKYYQLQCLAKTDPAAAEKSWKQFCLLHPQVKAAEWRERFDELKRTTFADVK